VFRKGRRRLDPASGRALTEILSTPKFELIPVKSVDEQTAYLPSAATVSVIASPTKTIEDTVALAAHLHEQGFSVVPHVAARMIADRAHLQVVLDALGAAGITRAFVIGGDATEPGIYFDALSLLRAMDELGHPFSEIGIGCYPEGHPLIAPLDLLQALHDKAPFAAYMTTQMCFDAELVASWIAARRNDGVTLPVHLGVPGVVEITKLVRLSARIGIGDSRRYLAKNTKLLGHLVRPGGYSPDGLLDGLGPYVADDALGIVALHLYTFNQVEATEAWRRRYLEELRSVETGPGPAASHDDAYDHGGPETTIAEEETP